MVSFLQVGGGMSVGQGGGCASSITRLVSQTGTLSEEIDIKVVAGCTRNYLSKSDKDIHFLYVYFKVYNFIYSRWYKIASSRQCKQDFK
jgi:hypothetical protein